MTLRAWPLPFLAIVATAAGCLGSYTAPEGSGGPIGESDLSAPAAGDLAAARDLGAADLAPPPGNVVTGDGGVEQLIVSVDTTTAGGNFAPNNVVAIWVEGPGGAFVRTLGRWSAARTQYLLSWNAKAGGADVDAVSGATRPNHATRLTVRWNMTARGGAAVADGTYTIRMELADRNSTLPTQNNEGTFTFDRNGTPAKKTALTNGGFNNVTLDYTGR